MNRVRAEGMKNTLLGRRTLGLLAAGALALVAAAVLPQAASAYPWEVANALTPRVAATGAVVLAAPDGAYVYSEDAATPLGGLLSKVRTRGMGLVATLEIPDDQGVYAGAISPDGRYGYFSAYHSHALVKVDLGSMKITGTAVLTLPSALGIVLSRDGAYAYVASDAAPSHVAKVDTAAMQQVGPAVALPGMEAAYIGLQDPTGRYAYFASHYAEPGLIAKVGISGAAPVADGVVEVTGGVGGMRVLAGAVAADGAHAYLTLDRTWCDTPAIRVIDLATMTQTAASDLAAQFGCPTVALTVPGSADLAIASVAYYGAPFGLLTPASTTSFAPTARRALVTAPADAGAASADGAYVYLDAATNPTARLLQVQMRPTPTLAAVAVQPAVRRRSIVLRVRVRTTGGGLVAVAARRRGSRTALCHGSARTGVAGMVAVSCVLGSAVREQLRTADLRLDVSSSLTAPTGQPSTTATAVRLPRNR